MKVVKNKDTEYQFKKQSDPQIFLSQFCAVGCLTYPCTNLVKIGGLFYRDNKIVVSGLESADIQLETIENKE